MAIPKPRDPFLKLPPSLYFWICFPLRILLGLSLILSARWTVEDAIWYPYAVGGVIALAALGLMRKGWVNRAKPVWKNYTRAVTGLMAGAAVLFVGAATSDVTLIVTGGILVLFDALMGQQSRHMGLFR